MADPLDLLSHFDPDPAAPPPTPSEVRRRGDRRRRRRTQAVVATAVVVAVIAVVTPLAVLGGGDDGHSAPPVATRVDGWLQEIPSDVDLAAGLHGVRPTSMPSVRLPACTTIRVSDQAVDSAGVSGDSDARLLEVLPDGATAAAVTKELRGRLAYCVSPLTDVAGVGDEAFGVFERRYRDYTSRTVAPSVEVVRVGNAVLVTSVGDPAYADATELTLDSARVVGAMSVFAAPATLTVPPPSGVLLVRSDLPSLGAGNPWRLESSNGVPALECQPTTGLPVTSSSSSRDFRTVDGPGPPVTGGAVRESVLQFPDAAAAAAGYAAVRGWVEQCRGPFAGGEQGPAVDDGHRGQVAGADYEGVWHSWEPLVSGATTVPDPPERDGAGLVGDRVVLVSLRVDRDPASPRLRDAQMGVLLRTALLRAADVPTTTRPDAPRSSSLLSASDLPRVARTIPWQDDPDPAGIIVCRGLGTATSGATTTRAFETLTTPDRAIAARARLIVSVTQLGDHADAEKRYAHLTHLLRTCPAPAIDVGHAGHVVASHGGRGVWHAWRSPGPSVPATLPLDDPERDGVGVVGDRVVVVSLTFDFDDPAPGPLDGLMNRLLTVTLDRASS